MGYRERRSDRRALDKQRGAALGFALFSGHGAGLFLAVAAPFQLFGRATPEFLGVVMLACGGVALLFGWGLMHAWNGLNADGEGRQTDAQKDMREAMDTAIRAFVAVIALLFIGGLSMFSNEMQRFAFPSPEPIGTAAPAEAPQISTSPSMQQQRPESGK